MITKEEYIARRKRLSSSLSKDSVAIVMGNSEQWRNGDANYRFRQGSDFYYLTGFEEPEALLVIESGGAGQSYLFNQPRDILKEQWHGRRLGQERAADILGVSRAFAMDTLAVELPALLANKKAVYITLNRHPALDNQFWQAMAVVKGQIRRGVAAPEAIFDLALLIAEMRLFKSQAEIDLMRKAAAISVSAHILAMKQCRKFTHEYELEAVLMHEFMRHGCRAPAYDSIVGGGENACILHYTENNRLLNDGELVLVDAGGEYENYAADITRTYPINGRFNDEQRAIYQVVLTAQKAGVAAIKPGTLWGEIQTIMVRKLTEGLCHLGLLSGNVSTLIEQEAYKPFYMHNSGHWLGLDVHDTGRYKIDECWRPLEPGMVLTVEPGLYISEGMAVDKRWWNIGVRIEDDILVTEEGHENLTEALVVEIDEIEALICGRD